MGLTCCPSSLLALVMKPNPTNQCARQCVCAGLAGTEESQEDGASEVDKETIHRLCPTYATDINSPLRHVRTRIYYTSESHVHSLVNVLRYSHLSKRFSSPAGLLAIVWRL